MTSLLKILFMKISFKVFLCSLVILGLSLMACEETVQTVSTPNEEYNLDVEKAKDVEMIYSDEGNVRVRVLSPSLVRHKKKQDPYTEFPDGLDVTFYSATLKKTSTLTAKYAIRQERYNKVIIQDSVVVMTVNNDKIETDELVWNEKKERITSDKFVKITTDDEEITGTGFRGNQDFSEYEIDSISGIVKIDKKGF